MERLSCWWALAVRWGDSRDRLLLSVSALSVRDMTEPSSSSSPRGWKGLLDGAWGVDCCWDSPVWLDCCVVGLGAAGGACCCVVAWSLCTACCKLDMSDMSSSTCGG
eukprot:scaffold28879_cov64-Cyclotella_meneghiniana.AAC.2